MNDEKGIAITNAFHKLLKESNCKSTKIWVDKGSEFYSRSMKLMLEKNNIEIFWTYNEKIFCCCWKIYYNLKEYKMQNCMTPNSKNIYIDKLDDIVSKYHKKCNGTINMNLVDVKSSTYVDSSKEINDKDNKFKSEYTVSISKYRTIFAKSYVQNWFEEVFVVEKVKRTLSWTYVTGDLKGEEMERFTKQNCKKQIKKSLQLKK